MTEMSSRGCERWSRKPEGSNRGDFGPDDQLGRLNLITPVRRRAAAQEVREGIAFCLSLPLDCPVSTSIQLNPRRHPPAHVFSMRTRSRSSLAMSCVFAPASTARSSRSTPIPPRSSILIAARGSTVSTRSCRAGWPKAEFRRWSRTTRQWNSCPISCARMRTAFVCRCIHLCLERVEGGVQKDRPIGRGKIRASACMRSPVPAISTVSSRMELRAFRLPVMQSGWLLAIDPPERLLLHGPVLRFAQWVVGIESKIDRAYAVFSWFRPRAASTETQPVATPPHSGSKPS